MSLFFRTTRPLKWSFTPVLNWWVHKMFNWKYRWYILNIFGDKNIRNCKFLINLRSSRLFKKEWTLQIFCTVSRSEICKIQYALQFSSSYNYKWFRYVRTPITRGKCKKKIRQSSIRVIFIFISRYSLISNDILYSAKKHSGKSPTQGSFLF